MYENYYYIGVAFDLGYEALAAIAKLAGLEFNYFYALYSTINIILFGVLSHWRTERMLLGLIPLMLFPGLPLNTIRQFTAGLICAIAYDRLYPRENKKYALLVLLACQFHISAALFLLPLAWKKIKVFALVFLFVFAALFYFDSYASYLIDKVIYYIDGSAREGWYKQSIVNSVIFTLLSLALLGAGYIGKVGDYKKYRLVLVLAAFSMLASAYMSIFIRFLYLFLPAISVWLYTFSSSSKLLVCFPLWIVGAVNAYFVWAVWSGESYMHRNYVFDLLG